MTVIAVAAQVQATDVQSVPKGGVHLDLSAGSTLAPVAGPDGDTLTGPDGRERCVRIGPPPRALATGNAADLAAADGLPSAAVGTSIEVVDRPLTLADTVPC